jgi:hypothetical protein
MAKQLGLAPETLRYCAQTGQRPRELIRLESRKEDA